MYHLNDTFINKERLQSLLPNAAWRWEEKAPCALQMAKAAWSEFENGHIWFGNQHMDLLYL